MLISELMHMSRPKAEAPRRIEVFTGTGRRRAWSADEKAAFVAESHVAGETVCGVRDAMDRRLNSCSLGGVWQGCAEARSNAQSPCLCRQLLKAHLQDKFGNRNTYLQLSCRRSSWRSTASLYASGVTLLRAR